ncbi:hypothetical protein B0T21DRAFT_358031 [Apiosordaria backusii]|uniref:Uncharacterized protein n=1 Tax=Apiosordaria backusii TaxID=314023 RepID=A0AA40ES99_9PEZI|nr:hypothetical protein B0T21DRAFT_358031 [Apiosordaria backusii]
MNIDIIPFGGDVLYLKGVVGLNCHFLGILKLKLYILSYYLYNLLTLTFLIFIDFFGNFLYLFYPLLYFNYFKS